MAYLEYVIQILIIHQGQHFLAMNADIFPLKVMDCGYYYLKNWASNMLIYNLFSN